MVGRTPFSARFSSVELSRPSRRPSIPPIPTPETRESSLDHGACRPKLTIVPDDSPPPPPRPPNTPDDVVITWQPAERVLPENANLEIDLPRPLNSPGTPRHRLVPTADSLTHGFKNFAISDTEHSWP